MKQREAVIDVIQAEEALKRRGGKMGSDELYQSLMLTTQDAKYAGRQAAERAMAIDRARDARERAEQ